jgi:hypothetical protein
VLAAVVVGAGLLAPAETPVLVLVAASILAAAAQLDWVALADDRSALAGALLLVRPAASSRCSRRHRLCRGPGRSRCSFSHPGRWRRSPLVGASRSPAARAVVGPDGAVMPVRSMLRAGMPLCAVTLLNPTLLSADLLLAGACLGAAAAGDYFLAAQVATAGLVLANAAGQSALARLAGLPPDSPAFAAALAADGACCSAAAGC